MEITCNKNKKSSNLFRNSKPAVNGEDGLCQDVLESIFQRLNCLDLLRAKFVSSLWYNASKFTENSHAHSYNVPWLLVPSQNKIYLFNPYEEKPFNSQTNEGFDVSCYVVGSSHGCVIFLDKNLMPTVLNPLSGSTIQLPRLLLQRNDCFALKSSINGGYIYREYLSHNRSKLGSNFLAHHWLRAQIVHKVILSSNPFDGSKKNCTVALIYGSDSELAYCNIGDHSWTHLHQKGVGYNDIIFYENKLYAVAPGKHDWAVKVDIWGFSGALLIKKVSLKGSVPINYWEHDWKFYLVESRGNILLVARGIMDNLFLRKIRYETVCFRLFEFDMSRKNWVEVKSIDGCALFLGGNHSLSVSTRQSNVRCDENCIYFTDDNWEGMNANLGFGGHDRGVFDMKDGKVRMFDDLGSHRMQPSPCWIVPKPLINLRF